MKEQVYLSSWRTGCAGQAARSTTRRRAGARRPAETISGRPPAGSGQDAGSRPDEGRLLEPEEDKQQINELLKGQGGRRACGKVNAHWWFSGGRQARAGCVTC